MRNEILFKERVPEKTFIVKKIQTLTLKKI